MYVILKKHRCRRKSLLGVEEDDFQIWASTKRIGAVLCYGICGHSVLSQSFKNYLYHVTEQSVLATRIGSDGNIISSGFYQNHHIQATIWTMSGSWGFLFSLVNSNYRHGHITSCSHTSVSHEHRQLTLVYSWFNPFDFILESFFF